MQYQRALTGQGDITDQKDGVSGFVTDIVFSSEQADWRVLEIDTDQDHELLIITGTMPDVEVGEHLDCKGGFQEHPRYGRQFQVKSYERSLPNDKETMERYLGSGMIVGIGPKLASRIVETFGDDTFTILETQPERLEEIKGISLKKACDIGEQFAQKAESRTVMICLTKLGLTPGMAMNIYKTFGAKTISTVEANPYLLAEKVSGIGFKKADEIARMAGLAEDAPARLKAAASYVLTDASMNGSTYLPRPDLLQRMFDLLQVDYQELENAVDQAEAGGVLIEKDGCVYLKHLALAERMAARRLVELDQFFSGPDHRAKEEPASLSGSHFKKDLEGIYKSMHESNASITAITTDMIKETFIIVNQKGTLTAISEDIDYRLGSSTLTNTELISGEKYVTFGGTEPPKFYSQFAIWKLTLKDGSGAALPATQLDVMEVGNGNEGIASVTIDASTVAANPGVVYVMLPAPVPPVVNVEATVGTVTYRVILSGVTLEVGKFYRSTLTISKQAGSISYTVTDVKKNIGDDAFINSLTNTGDGTVTYESSNTAVAEVDTDGQVIIKGTGSTTITATVADSDNYTYATKTAEYTITVTYNSTDGITPMDDPIDL